METDIEMERRIEDALGQYRPRESNSRQVADLYPDIRSACVETVRRSRLLSPQTARSRLSFITRFATWAHVQGLWRPDMPEADGLVPLTGLWIDGYVDSLGDGNRERHATSQLRSIARQVVPHWLDASTPVSPYLTVEQVGLWQAACRVRHDLDDPTVAATVALTFGAGLTGEDLAVMTADRVVRDPHGRTFVEVRGTGGRDRTVPVARPWVDRLIWAVEPFDGGPLVGMSDGRDPLAALMQRVRRAGLSVLSARKMRTTWLVNRLQDGVPLDVLMRYSAIRSGHAFDRLIPYLSARAAEVEIPMVAGDVRR